MKHYATGYKCKCKAGTTGPNCDVNINECLENPCVNGVCIDNLNGYKCECEQGYFGTNCDTKVSITMVVEFHREADELQ